MCAIRGAISSIFRNAEVRDYAERVIDRMVNEYGVGYIKMDYNIEPGTGTDQQADSTGQGLLEHNRAYLAWIDHIFEKYPELIIEKLLKRRHADGLCDAGTAQPSVHKRPDRLPAVRDSGRQCTGGGHPGAGCGVVLSADRR